MSAYYNEIDPFAADWLRELDECPFGDKDCENLPFHAWDTFLRERDTGKVFSDQGK